MCEPDERGELLRRGLRDLLRGRLWRRGNHSYCPLQDLRYHRQLGLELVVGEGEQLRHHLGGERRALVHRVQDLRGRLLRGELRWRREAGEASLVQGLEGGSRRLLSRRAGALVEHHPQCTVCGRVRGRRLGGCLEVIIRRTGEG